jgi:hypothetical protein
MVICYWLVNVNKGLNPDKVKICWVRRFRFYCFLCKEKQN